MEVSSKTLRAPRRQETLGPASPIQDWEVERATILADLKDSREKAERLEKELDKDRQTYEKNTASLLREVKLKESFMEKKLKDVEQQLMEQLVQVQRTLDDQTLSSEEQVKALKDQHEAVLEAEEKKYQRRLTSLQERLDAKDKEYAEIFEREKQLSQNNNEPTTLGTQEEEEESAVESLKLEVAKNKKEIAKLQELSNSNKRGSDDGTKNSSKEDLFHELESVHEELHQELEAIRSKYQLLREGHEKLTNELANAHKETQVLKKRCEQISSSHNTQIKELTEKFMSEAQRSEMTNQAQFENLQSENLEILRELKEQHETEKEVWHIQQTALIDEIRREVMNEKEEALRELNKEWKDKSDDLQASMSKDAMEIQSHWESKLTEANSKFSAKISRLQGEIQVVKDRLGHEIDRRKKSERHSKSLQEELDKYQDKYNQGLKQRTTIEKNMEILNSQHRTSLKLAKDLLSITSPNVSIDPKANLPGILQTAVRDASILRMHAETYNSRENTIPSYSFY